MRYGASETVRFWVQNLQVLLSFCRWKLNLRPTPRKSLQPRPGLWVWTRLVPASVKAVVQSGRVQGHLTTEAKCIWGVGAAHGHSETVKHSVDFFNNCPLDVAIFRVCFLPVLAGRTIAPRTFGDILGGTTNRAGLLDLDPWFCMVFLRRPEGPPPWTRDMPRIKQRHETAFPPCVLQIKS